MIWFGTLAPLLVDEVPEPLETIAETTRMERALERVAEARPGLAGGELLDALAATGWVERSTAQRLLPLYRHFDADRHFAEHVRRLSYRGRTGIEPFRASIHEIVREVTGSARFDPLGEEECIRFGWEDREGVVLAYSEVGFTLTGRTRDAIVQLVEEMPDALVVVARNFDRGAEAQLRAILDRTGVSGLLVSVNLLLGLRAMALRYRPGRERILELLARSGTLRSPEVARLAEPVAAAV